MGTQSTVIPPPLADPSQLAMPDGIPPPPSDPSQLAAAETPSLTGQLGRGLAGGYYGLKKSLAGATKMLSTDMGWHGITKWADGVIDEASKDEAAYTPSTPTLGDIKSGHKAAEFGAYSVGNTLPSSGASIAGSVIGGAIGSVAGPGGSKIGGMLGAAGISIAQNAGDVYTSLLEAGVPERDARSTALSAGIAMGLLDTALPVKVAGKIINMPAKEVVEKGLLRHVAKNLIKEPAIEGVTEAAQEAIAIAAERYQGVKKEGDLSGIINRIGTAGVAGSLGSGPISVASSVIEHRAGTKASATPAPDEKTAPPAPLAAAPVTAAAPAPAVQAAPVQTEQTAAPTAEPAAPTEPAATVTAQAEPVPTISAPVAQTLEGFEKQGEADVWIHPASETANEVTLTLQNGMATVTSVDTVVGPFSNLEDAQKVAATLVKESWWRTDAPGIFEKRVTPEISEYSRAPGADVVVSSETTEYGATLSVGGMPMTTVADDKRAEYAEKILAGEPFKYKNIEYRVAGLTEKGKPSIFISASSDGAVKLAKDPIARRLADTVANIVDGIQVKIPWIPKIPGVAIADISTDVRGTNYRGGGISITMAPQVDPDEAAAESAHTIAHEVTHQVASGHREHFAMKLADVYTALGLEYKNHLDQLKEVYASRRSSTDESFSPVPIAVQGAEAPQSSEGNAIGGEEGQTTVSSNPNVNSESYQSGSPASQQNVEPIRTGGSDEHWTAASQAIEERDAGFSRDYSEEQRADGESDYAEFSRRVKKVIGPNTYPKIKADLDKFGWFSKWSLTLLQIAERNPHIMGLQAYVDAVRKYFARKGEVTMQADQILKDWNMLSHAQAKALAATLLHVSVVSDKIRRRLTQVEEARFFSKHNLSPEAQVIYYKVQNQMMKALDDLETSLINQVTRLQTQPAMQALQIADIKDDMNKLRNRNYFPHSRFGDYGTIVRKRAGGRIAYFETYATKAERSAALKDIQKQYPDSAYIVSQSKLLDSQADFFGMPPSLVKLMEKRLKLNKQKTDELRDLVTSLAPGRSFAKNLLKKRGIAGFSADAQRAYAKYFQSLGGHLARIDHSDQMAEARNSVLRSAKQAQMTAEDATSRYEIADYLNRHFQYVMDPGNEMANLRSFMYYWWFAYVPSQAVINLTQVPMLTYPVLAHKFGDMKAGAALVAATRNVGKMFAWRKDLNQPYEYKPQALTDPALQQDVDQGMKDGFLDESFATEVGAIASNNAARTLGRYKVGKLSLDLLGFGVAPFKAAEGYNRLVTFIAARQLALGSGMSAADAYNYARDTVASTQGEYARWNKPMITRGLAAPLFIFKNMTQFLTYFAFTNPAAKRFWMMSLAMSGVLGLPFADDVLKFLSVATTALGHAFGFKNGKIDFENEARRFFLELGANPDLIMHGLSRYSWGLHDLGKMAGLPIPALDMSSSLSQGRVIPALHPALEAFEGTLNPGEAVARIGTELSGAGGSLAANAFKDVVGPKTLQMTRWVPRAVRNLLSARELAGKKDVDLDHPDRVAEVFGQVFGLTPTRLNTERDARMTEHQQIQYYEVLKAVAIDRVAKALAKTPRDPEEVKDAYKELADYNKIAPPPMRINAQTARRSIETKLKNQTLKELGKEGPAKYLKMREDFNRLFQVPPK